MPPLASLFFLAICRIPLKIRVFTASSLQMKSNRMAHFRSKTRRLIRAVRRTLLADFLAGATGAVAGAPQAMGFAIVAGVNPIYGLYAAVVSTIAGAFVTSSTFMTVAPTNALAIVTGSVLAGYSDSEQIERLFVLTLLVGVFQLAFGLLRLGRMTRFVSNAVMTGFIAGAGAQIILGQLHHLTGYHGEATGTNLERFLDWASHLNASDPQTSVIGVAAVIIIWKLHHTRWKSVATLVAILITTAFVSVAGWDGVATVRDTGTIPHGLPGMVVPDLSYAPELVFSALALAVLGSVQAAALSQNITETDGSVPDPTRDMVGQGVASIATGFFQGMPVAGSLSRTAVNVSAGARTRWANVFAGILVGGILLLLGPLIEEITLAALAGHLVVAAVSLLNPRIIKLVWRVNWSGRLNMVITFLATLFLPLQYSVYLGIGLSLLLYVYTSSSTVRAVRLVPIGDAHFKEAPLPARLPDDEPVIFSVAGNLYFGAIQRLEEQLPRPNGSHRAVVILRLRDNQYLGSTGMRFLERYARQLKANGGMLLLCGIGSRVQDELAHVGAVEWLRPEQVFFANEVILQSTAAALRYAEDWLAKTQADPASDAGRN